MQNHLLREKKEKKKVIGFKLTESLSYFFPKSFIILVGLGLKVLAIFHFLQRLHCRPALPAAASPAEISIAGTPASH